MMTNLSAQHQPQAKAAYYPHTSSSYMQHQQHQHQQLAHQNPAQQYSHGNQQVAQANAANPHPAAPHQPSQAVPANGAVQRQQSARKSLYQAYKSVATSSAYSPPLARAQSKQSKSLRFEPHEIAPISCRDYLWLLVYYVLLYTFFATFWFALWSIYMATTPKGKPRYPHDAVPLGSRMGYFDLDINCKPPAGVWDPAAVY